jgi:phage I-like protein
VKLAHLALVALPLPAGGGAPTEFRVLCAGSNRTEKGEFLFDDEAARLVMAAFAAKGLPKVQIDYEHQSQMPPPGGGDASKPAAGWFKPEVRSGELWATDVAWTARALAMLAPKEGAPEYRYFSPILFFDEDTRRVTRLKNIALTNDPAMDELRPLVAATARKDEPMPCESCTALTARLTTMEEECKSLKAKLSAWEDKDKEKGAVMTALSGDRDKLVALTGQSTVAAALGTVEGWKAAAGRVQQLEADRAKETEATLTTEMKGVLDAAEKGGKLAPAMRALEEKGALAFGQGKVSKEGVDYLAAKWGAAPKIVHPNGEGGPNPQDGGVAVLTAADLEVAKAMGHNPEEVLKFKTEQLKKRALSALGR